MEIHQAIRTHWSIDPHRTSHLSGSSVESDFAQIIEMTQSSRLSEPSSNMKAKSFSESSIFGTKRSSAIPENGRTGDVVKSESALPLNTEKTPHSSSYAEARLGSLGATVNQLNKSNLNIKLRPTTTPMAHPQQEAPKSPPFQSIPLSLQQSPQLKAPKGEVREQFQSQRAIPVMLNASMKESAFMNVAVASTLHGLDVKIKTRNASFEEKKIVKEKVIEFLEGQKYSLLNIEIDPL